MGVEQDTTMRDRFQRADHRSRQLGPVPAAEHALVHQEMVREFGSCDVDLDDLAQAIRRLLDSGTDADLLSPDRRATHVMGREAT